MVVSASLLEVGTGFHPELTGRENTFLTGAILGMSKREITRKFDEIVAFAELEKFIDTPVKHYSSGMYVRLAFAVAAHLEPEILLVDEVLAVGDIKFPEEMPRQNGRRGPHGPHRGARDPSAQPDPPPMPSRRLDRCRAVRQNGPTHEVVGAYEWAMARGDSNGHSQDRRAGTKGRFLKWEIAGPLGGEPHVLTSMGQVTVKFTVQINEPIENGHHGIALFNQ